MIEGNADLRIAIPGPILYTCLQYNKVKFAKFLLSRGAPVNQRTICNQSCFYKGNYISNYLGISLINFKCLQFKAFLMRNYDFILMCILNGFNLYKNEPWILSYLNNPSLAGTPSYFVNRRSNSHLNELNSDVNSNSDNSNRLTIRAKSDHEIAEMLNLDEYLFERFHSKSNLKLKEDKEKNILVSKKIYALIRHYYTNPLSLKQLARIQIRKSLVGVDFKMKYKINKHLDIPAHLKDYLMFTEFNL